ncbi:kinase [Rhodococcus rhodochrous]|uniref:kinase n=1 Tax=Rhodococcus rhodochrous TaxID=1829 RepID=UPI001E5839E5|nr:kinase [Rhodococcus rhodochrous]MCD2095747.1 kinase [Rhodococcus rhodochrous]MCD2119819.1 kinase [Rhodococcus rhodochrous]MCQ4134854.1 kinase [Rhodococcus rhodochrous]MDJ0016683.1 kinase [Rhodococcus rhodochrous]
MTATLADPVSEVVHAAEALLTRRTGATVTLTDPVDLGGSGRSVVVRVRVAANPFSLPRTLVLKQVPASRGTGHVDFRGSETDEQIAFLREAVSYQFTTALAKDHRPGAELLAYDFEARLLVLSDLGDATTLSEVLRNSSEAAGNTLMALAQALGRMHAATVGREEDFAALLRRADVARVADAVSQQALDAVRGVPELLEADFGLSVPESVRERAERASKLFTGGRFRAFSPSDLCPDNIVVGDAGVQFLDYEWGGFRDATLDIAYALSSFPLCLCSVPLSVDRIRAMADAWRAEVVAMWPQLAYDEVLEERLLDALLACIWLSTHLFLPEDHARIASVREHGLSVPRIPALRARWSLLAEFATATGHDDVAAHARDVLAHLEDRAAG